MRTPTAPFRPHRYCPPGRARGRRGPGALGSSFPAGKPSGRGGRTSSGVNFPSPFLSNAFSDSAALLISSASITPSWFKSNAAKRGGIGGRRPSPGAPASKRGGRCPSGPLTSPCGGRGPRRGRESASCPCVIAGNASPSAMANTTVIVFIGFIFCAMISSPFTR